MPNDFNARLERLEKARQAARKFIDNPPPVLIVHYVESDGDGGIATEQSDEDAWVVDPMPAILARRAAR